MKRRSWWELFGWSWRVVRFVARKLLGRAKRALTGGLFDAGNAVPVTSDPGAAFGAENASRNEEQLSTLSTLPNDEHLCGESSDLLKQFQQNGSKPWASGYHEYKWETLAKYIQADFSAIVGTEKYGYRIDERAVELPWLLSRLDNNPGVMLDAGSALNFPVILQHPKICSKKLFISTLAYEGSAWPELGISYVYEDLRHTSFQENFFDSIACISTIEHIGMDNTFLYTADTSKKEQNIEDYLSFLDVMHSRLKPGGRLYLSFPFGKACNHSWLQIFDAAMTDRLIARFQPTTCLETIFYYSNDCWHLSSRKEAREAAYFDINVQKEYESDFLAAARSVACLELVK